MENKTLFGAFNLSITERKDIRLYMKKEELKRSLAQIKPRKELVDSTIVKIREQKYRESRGRSFSPGFSKGLRLAGAFCAFVFVFCIGFAVAKNNFFDPTVKSPEGRIAGELDTADGATHGLDIAMYSLEDDENGRILEGHVRAFRFTDLTDDDHKNSVMFRCVAEIAVSDLETGAEENTIVANVVFYDSESMNMFIDPNNSKLLFKIVPSDDGNWSIVDFALPSED